MSKYLTTLKLLVFCVILYIWSADTIEFPGEKQGEDKKKFVLRSFNEVVDAKLPNIPLVDTIQALISGFLGQFIDWAVAQLKKNADYVALQNEITGFFLPAQATTTSPNPS